ncbi:MAG: HIT domain-containing protein [Bacteroidales bacterium]
MTFQELKHFLQEKMLMSHIYQPLLIKILIDSGGYATVRHLALQFLGYDESQLLYYEKTLKNMPIKVLSKHGVIKYQDQLVSLEIKKLSLEQKAEIRMICEQKIQEFIVSRGLSLWDYRLLDTNIVPDSLRFRILKEGKGRCALCGATKDDRMLDIDHIKPVSKGGKTEYANLQVLCSKCNRSKRDKDQTDFRKLVFDISHQDCHFCNINSGLICILENDLAFAIDDKYPVTKHHTLIIPRRHFADYFEITQNELIAINELMQTRKKILEEEDPSIEGFNIGVNSGKAAGQTIDHLHFHLIPRRSGDTKDPEGGVRGVIPEKMKYYI